MQKRRDNIDNLENNGPRLEAVPLEQIFIYSSLPTYFNISIILYPSAKVYVKRKQI